MEHSYTFQFQVGAFQPDFMPLSQNGAGTLHGSNCAISFSLFAFKPILKQEGGERQFSKV